MMLADAHILDMQSTKSRICILQWDLTHMASQTFAEDDFESHWTTRCSVKEREEFILEGLVRACGASPDFEESRKWCPELTLNRLNHGSGRGFLDLVKKLTFQDLDNIPTEFRTVPSAVLVSIASVVRRRTKEGLVECVRSQVGVALSLGLLDDIVVERLRLG
ncbi:hypothetical protein B0H13DRAFT_1956405 [Mycena leptocephala]|nr:hypothetical protein B0H13DRAFT_1956405 [Mycena leptocephala]